MDNNLLSSIGESLTSAMTSVFVEVVMYIPTLLASLLVFVTGLILANWLKLVVVKVLNVFHLSEILEHGGLKQFLENAQVTQKIESIIGEAVRYVVIFIFSVTSINLLGLNTITQVLVGLLSYIPNILASVFILGAGVVLAGFLERVVKGSLGSVDLRLSRLLAKSVSYLVVIFAILAAISQLGIARNFIDALFMGFIGTLSLALGLSLGLGSKDLVKGILEEWYKDFRKDLK